MGENTRNFIKVSWIIIKFRLAKKQTIELSAIGLLTLLFLSSLPIGMTSTNSSETVVDDYAARFIDDQGSSPIVDGSSDDISPYHFSNLAANAPYTVNHADSSTVAGVNQKIDGGEWISLGVYNFYADYASVTLSEDTNEVIIEAMKLVSLESSPDSTPSPKPEPSPFYVTLSYSSTPIDARAIVDGKTLSSGESAKVALDSTVTIQVSQTQGYDFSHWIINDVKRTQNPLNLEISADLSATAVYTIQQPPPSTSEMIVGVNMWSGTSTNNLRARDIPLLKQAGIDHVRIGTGVRDSFVNTALAEGISVIGTFHTNGLPDLSAFGDYVYNRVSHFKGRINAWVVFNEANYVGFRGNPQSYTQALRTAYTRAKQADPNVKIVTTNFLSTEGGLEFLEEMYRYGAQGYFDVLGVDPYCYPEPPTEPSADRWGHTFWGVPKMHDLMVENGDGDKPVWIVEFGYRTPSDQYPLGHSTVASEEEQAEFIVEALELARTWPWLERFYIYEWMDSADVDLGRWGLVRESYTASYDLKPAYFTVQEFLSR